MTSKIALCPSFVFVSSTSLRLSAASRNRSISFSCRYSAEAVSALTDPIDVYQRVNGERIMLADDSWGNRFLA